METFRVQWFIRLKEHKKLYNETCFVTYTYDDEHIPYGDNSEGPEGYVVYSLFPRDMQLYFKRLRKYYRDKRISYYMVGEYGTDNLRPHYHAIIFGLGRDDEKGIKKHWKCGFVHIGSVTDASLNYVCKYHLLRGQAPMGAYPSFSRMSKNIGLNYVDKKKDWHNKEVINRSFYWLNGFKKQLPRYYRDRIYSEKDRSILGALNEKKALEKLKKELPGNLISKKDILNFEYQRSQKNRQFKLKAKKGGKL